jgi:enoyl-CoA hydratase/carnithine racemase
MTVTMQTNDHIATIDIDGHGEYNLFSPEEVYDPLTAALEEFRDTQGLWVAQIRAATGKKAFTYGGHLGSVAKIRGEEGGERRGYQLAREATLFRPEDASSNSHRYVRLLRRSGFGLYKPVVCVIEGACYGAGTMLVNALADYVVATPEAKFGVLQVRQAASRNIEWELSQCLPYRIAAEMVMRARKLTAEEALRWGFINAVSPQEEIRAFAHEVVQDFASMPPLTVQAAKRTFAIGHETGGRGMDLVGDLFTTVLDRQHDAREGVRAFAEKRKPEYTGEIDLDWT